MFKNLSLTQNVGYGTLFFGVTLVCSAILDFIDYAFLGIVVSVLSIIMAASSFFLIQRSFDGVDEMAEKHIGEAAFATLWFMVALWSACSFSRHFIDYTLVPSLVLLSGYLGISVIFFSAIFIFLEKEGD